MKITFLTGILVGTIAGMATAQDNPFAKTAWKIEAVNEDGSALLTKTKMKQPQEQAKFYYIQFDNSKDYTSGTSCFSTGGRYEILEDHQIALNGMDAAMGADCTEPSVLSGIYFYEMSKEGVKLRRVEESEQQSNEEPYEAAEAAGAEKVEK